MTDYFSYHLHFRWLGIEHVYITDMGKPSIKPLSSQLRDFIKVGFVTLLGHVEDKEASSAHRRCMEEYRHKHNWLAFIDTDEFLVVRKECAITRPILPACFINVTLVFQIDALVRTASASNISGVHEHLI